MLLFENCAFVQVTVPNVPMKVLKEMCLTAARLLQQGELTAADAELRLRRLSVQLLDRFVGPWPLLHALPGARAGVS